LLESLHAQTYPISEVLIADGGSTDGTRELIAADPLVTLVDNPRRHAAAGRNTGFNLCTGDWVMFTDGDCRPDPDWAERLMAVASGPDVIGVGGRVIVEPRTVFEKVCAEVLLGVILRHGVGSRPVVEKSLDGALVTANCVYRRDILQRVGGFDERFSNFGEDIDLMFRVLDLQAGTVQHTTDACVIADMPATFAATLRKWRQYGMASSHLHKYHHWRPSIDIGLYRRMLGLMWQAARTSGDTRAEAFVGSVQLACHIGGKLEGSMRLRTVNL
jgi:cellulose synthase/poly-beta-1,6-N-acetylglucosamine synthase-like glycosyltransferase